jgi:cytochrome c oxidase assembly protein Cox11
MAERRVTRCQDIAILTYRVSAEKADVPIYKALCASTYLNDDDTWLRISHQQTMVA